MTYYVLFRSQSVDFVRKAAPSASAEEAPEQHVAVPPEVVPLEEVLLEDKMGVRRATLCTTPWCC